MDTSADSSTSPENVSATSPPSGPPPSGCQYENAGDTSIITLKPELNDVKWDAIESIGNNVSERLESTQPSNVLFDLTPLTYVGSAMVALVARWWKIVNASGGQCAVAVANDNVLEVLKLAKLDTHWDIVPSREAGFKKLGVSGATTAAPASSGTVAHTSGPLWPIIVGSIGLTLAALILLLELVTPIDEQVVGIVALVGGLIAAAAGFIGAAIRGAGGRAVLMFIGVVGALLAIFGGVEAFVWAAGPVVDGDDIEAVEDDVEAIGDNAAAAIEASDNDGNGVAARPVEPGANTSTDVPPVDLNVDTDGPIVREIE